MPEGSAKRAGTSVLKTILASLLLILIIIVAAGFWYFHTLDSILEKQENLEGSAEQALTEPQAGEPFYTLILGSDTRDPMNPNGERRSDVMILLRMNPAQKEFTMVSIPRDTIWVREDGSVLKINEAYNVGGVGESVRAVSQLTGVQIAHYVETDIDDVVDMVNILGGVQVYVPTQIKVTRIDEQGDITLEEGVQELDGLQAQAFARARHELESGEAGRQSNVRTLAGAMFDSLTKRPFWEIPGKVLELAEFMHTDIRTGDIIPVMFDFLHSPAPNVSIYSASGPSSGNIREDIGGLWFCYENPEGWAELMRRVNAGGDPGTIDYSATEVKPQQGQQPPA